MHTSFVLGMVGKGSPSSLGKKEEKLRMQMPVLILHVVATHGYTHLCGLHLSEAITCDM